MPNNAHLEDKVQHLAAGIVVPEMETEWVMFVVPEMEKEWVMYKRCNILARNMEGNNTEITADIGSVMM